MKNLPSMFSKPNFKQYTISYFLETGKKVKLIRESLVTNIYLELSFWENEVNVRRTSKAKYRKQF